MRYSFYVLKFMLPASRQNLPRSPAPHERLSWPALSG